MGAPIHVDEQVQDAVLSGAGKRRQSKIVLAPLNEEQEQTQQQQQVPSPHMSAPVLPPIRSKKRQRTEEDIRLKT